MSIDSPECFFSEYLLELHLFKSYSLTLLERSDSILNTTASLRASLKASAAAKGIIISRTVKAMTFFFL